MKILNILTKERKVGNIGENASVKYLKKNKYKILKRNFVAMGYEIDIIAENEDTLAFIEVKTRITPTTSSFTPRPASSVTAEKQRKIIAAAQCFLSTHRTKKYVGLDVIEVYLNNEGKKQKVIDIKHMKDAFNANTAYKNYYLQKG